MRPVFEIGDDACCRSCRLKAVAAFFGPSISPQHTHTHIPAQTVDSKLSRRACFSKMKIKTELVTPAVTGQVNKNSVVHAAT